MKYILTHDGVAFFHNGKNYEVSRDHKYYEEVVDAIKSGESAEEVMNILNKDVQILKDAVQVLEGMNLEFNGGSLYFEGEPLGDVLSKRILQMRDEGFPLEPMGNFIRNLFDNPSRRVVQHLYEFLEYGRCPITEDGCFLVYKAVREDYKDIHSGTFDNSIGAVVTMRRNSVDEDPDRTCSAGLHVCSYGYLPHFAHANGHVMICKVNPADVVAIPRDYNNTKMRVCKYEVVEELAEYYKNVSNDVLAKASVAVKTDTYVFVIEGLDEDGDWNYVNGSNALSDTAQLYDQELETNSEYLELRIRNTATDVVIAQDDVMNYEEPQQDEEYEIRDEFDDLIQGGFDSLSEAVSAAIDMLDDEDVGTMTIVDSTGHVYRTIS